ncbi:hypothetical protein [Anaerotignum sp.]|uniref:hypothetical protein n=1 Tax=Anaerotignum sp. TaxID=2039241 RepID=UPI003A8BD49D
MKQIIADFVWFYMSCEFLSEWQHVAGLFYWDTMENSYAVNGKNKFSGDIVIQHKGEFTTFFHKKYARVRVRIIFGLPFFS